IRTRCPDSLWRMSFVGSVHAGKRVATYKLSSQFAGRMRRAGQRAPAGSGSSKIHHGKRGGLFVRSSSLMVAVLLFALLAGSLSAAAQGSLAIVFDVGGRGDLSFNDMGALGGDRAQRELGVTVREVESATTADFLPNLRALARTRQYDLIAGIGFLLQDAMAQVAAEFPNQKFAIMDGLVEGLPNVMSVSFADHE